MGDLPEHEVRRVTQYVESQTRDVDDPVTVVQRIGSRRVSGVSRDMYDVRMAKGDRYWVITEPMNLYHQDDFHQVEMAFTYHLGVSLTLRERFHQEVRDAEGGEEVSPAWRRLMKAGEAMDNATEAEDFQAVGVRCREALLAYVRDRLSAEWVADIAQPPKAEGDVKGWLSGFAEVLAPSSRKRRYLKALGDKTWDLTVWLQHYADATEWDAELVLHATAHALNAFDLAIIQHDEGKPRRCPQCDSYRVMQDGDVIERDGQRGWWTQDVCSACDWRGDETFEPWPREPEGSITD